MKIIDKAIPSRKPKTNDSQIIIYFYAVFLVIFAFCQLFSFDEFLRLLDSFLMPGGLVIAHLTGGLIVVSEVLALPFLLRLKLSPLMRVISMIMCWLVPIIWLKISLWLIFSANPVSNIGFLGTIVDLVPGWWTVFICIALGFLAAWASWSMWPLDSSRQTNKNIKK